MEIISRYGVFEIPSADDVISKSLMEYGEWAQIEIDKLAKFIRHGDKVVDAGAYIGTHTIAFSKLVGNEGKVFAFEPNPAAFKLLKNNCERNSLRNVVLYPYALGSSEGQMKLIVPVDNIGGSYISSINEKVDKEHIVVEVYRLDSVLRGEEINFIKGDIEGMEFELLKGGEELISKWKPVIFLETNNIENTAPIIMWARSSGYIVYGMINPAYNEKNYKGSTKNIFGEAKECGVLLIHRDKAGEYEDSVYILNLPKIETLDDMALLLLHKPQYPYEVFKNSKAGLKLDINYPSPAIISIEREKEELSRRLAESENKLTESKKEKEQLSSKILEMEREIEGFYSSTSWKITAPLRAAKRTFVRIIQFFKSWLRWVPHKMTLHTLTDLIPEGKEIFRSTGNSPQFVISSNKKHLPAGWVYISLSIEYLDIKEMSPSPKLIPDNWSGFKDELAVFLPFVKKGKIRTVAKFPDSVRAIRFDPCNSPGRFLIRQLKIVEIGKLQVALFLLWRIIKPLLFQPSLLIRNIMKAFSILKSGGFNTLREKIISKASHQWEIEPSPFRRIEIFSKPGEGSPWEDYYVLSKKIKEMERERLNRISPVPPKIFTVDERKLKNYAERLNFPYPDNPLVSIIIPVHNNIKLTIECLISVITYTKDIPYEVIIVDDASTDETEEVLSKVKSINYIKNAERKGFVHSCNTGAKRARGEFLVILNNDTQVTKNWLPPLINTFTSHENTGVVSPKVIYPNGKLQEAGCLINPDGSTKLIGLFDDPNLPRYNYIREVDYVSAVCMVVKRSLFDETGGFDENFSPGYYEDVDFCLKVRSRGFRILYNPHSVVVHHLSATYSKISPHLKYSLVISNQQKLCEKWQKEIDDLNKIKLIAFYLPQYHPIIENDIWWGTGFTDWNKVVSAKPNFAGHYQPHLPSDLGFYDLRVLEVMEKQAELAKKYGIYGFCFYYYWFGGKRLLEMPLERLLSTGKPDIPFCLCWANENWTRRWDGMENEILIAQSYDDDVAVIKDVIRYMRHPNYIRIKGKPLFLVYRINLFPDIKKTVSVWREVCKKEGIGEIYLAMVNSFENAVKNPDPGKYGFDASVEFPPHGFAVPIPPPGEILNPDFKGVVSDYRETVLKYIKKEIPNHVHFRAVLPGWDNTPRRQNDGYIFHYSSPGAYQAWLERMIQITREQNGPEERIIFINAWNEWGEGCHLEPDQRFGHAFLEATRNALEKGILFSDEG